MAATNGTNGHQGQTSLASQTPLDMLGRLLAEPCFVKCRNGRELSGKLHAYDEHLNIDRIEQGLRADHLIRSLDALEDCVRYFSTLTNHIVSVPASSFGSTQKQNFMFIFICEIINLFLHDSRLEQHHANYSRVARVFCFDIRATY
eukprot:g5465.t1